MWFVWEYWIIKKEHRADVVEMFLKTASVLVICQFNHPVRTLFTVFIGLVVLHRMWMDWIGVKQERQLRDGQEEERRVQEQQLQSYERLVLQQQFHESQQEIERRFLPALPLLSSCCDILIIQPGIPSDFVGGPWFHQNLVDGGPKVMTIGVGERSGPLVADIFLTFVRQGGRIVRESTDLIDAERKKMQTRIAQWMVNNMESYNERVTYDQAFESLNRYYLVLVKPTGNHQMLQYYNEATNNQIVDSIRSFLMTQTGR